MEYFGRKGGVQGQGPECQVSSAPWTGILLLRWYHEAILSTHPPRPKCLIESLIEMHTFLKKRVCSHEDKLRKGININYRTSHYIFYLRGRPSYDLTWLLGLP